MTIITIIIEGEEHAVIETVPVKALQPRPTRADYAMGPELDAYFAGYESRATYEARCAAHSRANPPEAPLAHVKTVSVPSEAEIYYNNGERKTYCVTTVDAVAVACTCPDFHFRRRICKHMVTAGTYDQKGAAIL